jgi:hypothetical protein
MPFKSVNARTSNQNPARIYSYTVKRMSFDQCRFGEDFLSLVSCFKALETIHFFHSNVEPHTAEATTTPCSGFECLLSYREEAGRDYRIDFTRSILSRAPSLRKVELSIGCSPPPAMAQVLAKCSAEVSLTSDSYREVSSSAACSSYARATRPRSRCRASTWSGVALGRRMLTWLRFLFPSSATHLFDGSLLEFASGRTRPASTRMS